MATLELLRTQKKTAVDRMEALNELAHRENRDLTEVEKAEYDAKKAHAENLFACIRELEQETNFGAPAAAPIGVNRFGVPYRVEGLKIQR